MVPGRDHRLATECQVRAARSSRRRGGGDPGRGPGHGHGRWGESIAFTPHAAGYTPVDDAERLYRKTATAGP